MKIDLFKDSLVMIYVRILTTVTGLIQGMILARALSIHEYGIYSQVMIVITFAIAFFGVSLPNSVNYFLVRINTEEDRRFYLSQIISVSNYIGLFTLAIIALSSLIISDFFNEKSLLYLLIIASPIPLLRLLAAIFDNVFVVLSKTRIVATRRTVMSILQVCLILIIWLLGYGIGEVIIAMLLTDLLIGIYVIYTLNLEMGKLTLFKLNLKYAREILIYTMPLAISTIVGVINLNVGKIYITRVFGTEFLAVYTNLTRELPLYVIASAVSAVIAPQIARLLKNNEKSKVLKLWKVSTELSFLSVIWIVGILFIAAPEVITFLYSEKYLSNIYIFQIFTLIIMFRIIYFGMILSGAGKTKLILKSAIISLIVNVIILFAFHSYLGHNAPVISTFISAVTMQFLQLYYSSKIMECKFTEIFPWVNLIKIILVNLTIGIIIYQLIEFLRIESFHYIVTISIVSFTWLLIFSLVYFKRFRILRHQLKVE